MMKSTINILVKVMFLIQLSWYGIQASTNARSSRRECMVMKHNDFTKCNGAKPKGPPPRASNGKPKGKPKGSSNCKPDNICTKQYKMAGIQYDPYYGGMGNQIKMMLSECCGKCLSIDDKLTFKSIATVNLSSIKDADIVYPIFSRSSNKNLFGFWYIPLLDIPRTFYVTRLKTPEETMGSMLYGFSNLWPLLLFCILFAMLAGYIIWLLETWGNKDEFPRPFLNGTWEGFWWSFVSMTTVGYGDKTPRSFPARIFSILWILIGITIFSMLTASLTNIITDAETSPSTDMAGKTVGALKDRVYDATVIARHGGLLHAIEHNDIITGVTKLIDLLLKYKSIDGFLVDRHTYYFYMEKITKGGKLPLPRHLKLIYYGEKRIEGEKLSYGMLIKNENEYHYFRKYVVDNWFIFETCLNLDMNVKGKNMTSQTLSSLYSIDNGLFYHFLWGTLAAFGVAIFIGVLYELYRWKKRKGVVNNKHAKDNPIAMSEN